jgi:hypothetical protein
MSSNERAPRRLTRSSFTIVIRLSQLAALECSRPCSELSDTSLAMPRMVDVIGATVTAESAGIATWRVTTKTGRTPRSGKSASKISPRSTRLTSSQTLHAEKHRRAASLPPDQSPGRRGAGHMPPGIRGRSVGLATRPTGPPAPVALRQPCSRTRHARPRGRVPVADPLVCESQSVLSCDQHTAAVYVRPPPA